MKLQIKCWEKKEALSCRFGASIFKGKEKYYFNILKSCFEIEGKKKDMYLGTMERDGEKKIWVQLRLVTIKFHSIKFPKEGSAP